MKPTKTEQQLRDRLLKDMRYNPSAPPDAAYFVRVGNRSYFGSDTHELLNRAVKIAQRRGKP